MTTNKTLFGMKNDFDEQKFELKVWPNSQQPLPWVLLFIVVLLYKWWTNWGRFVGQKLVLSSSFSCDLRQIYDFGHTLSAHLKSDSVWLQEHFS